MVLGWKKLSYWMRGGIVGVLTGVFLVALGYFMILESCGELCSFVLAYPLWPGPFLVHFLFESAFETSGNLLGFYFAAAFWFMVGALAGWFYSKIKSRRLLKAKC